MYINLTLARSGHIHMSPMLFTKFIRIFNLTCPNLQAKYKFVHTYIYKMDKAYMRCPEGSEVFELSFQYFNQELDINRQFNFTRKLSESVSTFLARVNTNISKALDKKQKKRKNADENPTNDSPKQVQLTQNGEQVNSDLLCEDLFRIGGDIRLKLLDQEYTVVINTPWIKNIVLPTSMLANFPVYPAKFETLFLDKKLSQFTWHKSLDKINWNVAGTGFLYTPSKSDIDCFLKLDCVPRNENDVGPVTETISAAKIEADRGQCPFDIRHGFTRDKLSGKNFRVVTYNILADLYCDSEYSRTVLFPYCAAYALSIDYRKQLVLKELIGYNADIICLQEVDEKVFDNDLSPVLGTFGLEGKFHKKGGTLREGLACFYNTSRFRLVESLCIVLGEGLDKNPLFADLWSIISKNDSLTKRLSERGTSVQITVLESIENNEILLVANTHLYFHPDADHIRLLQVGISNIYIEETIRRLKESKQDKQISVIYCGDFNSVPECGIYKLFTTGLVPDSFVDWTSNTEEAVTGLSLTNNRLLTSACGTPKYTNFTEGFKDCLDYIFYETNKFEVTQVVPLPSVEELSAHTAIPSVLVPSDHVALIADLSWL